MLRTGRQPGQVFYHRKPGGSGGNGFKLPPNVGRGVWFGIETIMLTQPTREKNINRGLGLAESFALFWGATARKLCNWAIESPAKVKTPP